MSLNKKHQLVKKKKKRKHFAIRSNTVPQHSPQFFITEITTGISWYDKANIIITTSSRMHNQIVFQVQPSYNYLITCKINGKSMASSLPLISHTEIFYLRFLIFVFYNFILSFCVQF